MITEMIKQPFQCYQTITCSLATTIEKFQQRTVSYEKESTIICGLENTKTREETNKMKIK